MTAQSEKGLIGCLLLSPVVCFHQAQRAGVTENWFCCPDMRTAWQMISAMDRERVNTMTVAEEAGKRGKKLDPILLDDCVQAAPIPQYLPHWIKELRQLFLRREIKRLSGLAVFESDDADIEPDEVIARMQTALHDATADAEIEKQPAEIYRDIITTWKSAKENKSVGLPSCWQGLNKLIGGYRPGQVYIVAARPAKGKTTFMTNEMLNLALAGHRVSVASIEMSEHQLRAKMLATDIGRSEFLLDTGYYDYMDVDGIESSAAKHAELPIRINDQYMTAEKLYAWGQFEAIKHGAQMIAIDYLQLISTGRKSESRNMEMTNIMQKLCELGKSTKVPIMVLSQLSRSSEHEKRAPNLHDLRDSGSIEQAAYCVIFIHHVESEDGIESSQFIVSKNRGGPTGIAPVVFKRDRQQFIEGIKNDN